MPSPRGPLGRRGPDSWPWHPGLAGGDPGWRRDPKKERTGGGRGRDVSPLPASGELPLAGTRQGQGTFTL